MPNMKLKTGSTPIKKTNSGVSEGSEGVTGMKIEFIVIEEESIIDSYSSNSNSNSDSDSDSDIVEVTNDGESDTTTEENKEDESIKVEAIEEVKKIPWTYWRSTEPSVGNIDIDPESIRRDLLAQTYTNEGEVGVR